MFESIDIHPGRINHDTPGLKTQPDFNRNVEDLMKWFLREDMYQIIFPANLVIDVGWQINSIPEWMTFYEKVEKGEITLNEHVLLEQGEFCVSIVDDKDWDTEENGVNMFCKSFKELEESFENALFIVRQKLIGLGSLE